ncbi:MAG: MFS transporter [SAR202 cluster bacterium]|nr:MFS transporter [Dehalococcoidia bacterium]MQG49806.1 MFS transporter [SAR202 cluster bacterium]MQG79294.1 MFS transporter [SAR202 cluster bacterium]|tara:strand:- start:421 stop:1689 length:1269 start_codon:yes stop_codon:yes gene_type:complete
MTSPQTARYEDLPRSYHIFKWRILLAFAGFYLFLYLGRFNFWPVAPLVKEDLALSNFEIGLVNALLLWGFGIGDLVHGRLAETYGLRLWVMIGAILTTVFNIITSFATSAVTMAIPWGIAGFVNAACWAPGISMVSQWWPRKNRGLALGIVGTAAGGAMVMMWWISGYVGAEWGWRASFRYPPMIIAALGIAFYFIARDRPTDVDLPEYVEDDEVSAAPEAIDPERLKGFGPYKVLMGNSRFVLACHVKGLENVVRYGLTTWVPIYYFEEGGLSIESTILLTILLPLGYLIAPPVSGIISDRFLGSRRRPMVIFSCAASAIVLVSIALAPPVNVTLGAVLLLIGGLSMGMSPMSTVAVDIAGRHMSGTSSGLLDAHGYAYAGAQALIFAAVLDMAGSPWPIVFLAMAVTRVVSGLMISRVKV